MDFIDDDENVRAMRDTARRMGLASLLLDMRRELCQVQASLDLARARVTRALMLLGVPDEGDTR